MDEAQTGSSPVKDRENGSEAASTGSERGTASEASVKQATELAANGSPAHEDDESAIASGSPEAAAIDAIALGAASEESADAPEPGEDAEVAAAVRGEPEPVEPLPAAPPAVIDFDEADRFAASIRPSWAEVSPVSQQPPPDAIGAGDGAPRVVRHNTLLEISPLRKRRASAYAILLASLVGVASLLYFGISSSSVDHVAHRGLNASDAQPTPHILKPAPEVVETKINPAQQAPVELEGPRPRLAAPSEPDVPAEAPSQQELAQNEPAPQLAAPQPGESGPELETGLDPEKPELAAPAAQAPAATSQALAAAAQAPAAAPQAPAAAPQAPAAATQALAAAPQAPATALQARAADQAVATQPQAAQPQAAQPPPAAQQPPTAVPHAAIAANDTAPKGAEAGPQPAAPQPATSQPVAATAPLTAAPVKAAPNAAANAPQPTAAGTAAKPAIAAKDPDKAVLSLAAYPPNTRLRIDGMIVENPYRARLPKYGKHRIEAAAPGFVPETHMLRMEADVQLMIALKRETGSDIKSDPYQAESPRRAATTVASPTAPKRDRGAGFVSDNPY